MIVQSLNSHKTCLKSIDHLNGKQIYCEHIFFKFFNNENCCYRNIFKFSLNANNNISHVISCLIISSICCFHMLMRIMQNKSETGAIIKFFYH